MPGTTMDAGQLTHLQMMRYSVLRGGTIKLDTAATFDVQINPADFKHHCGVRYDEKKSLGQTANTPRYATVGDERVSFSLVLDGTGIVPPPANGQRDDVKTLMQKLNAIVYQYLPMTKEPPYVRLLWGTLIFFSRLESMATQYTLFKPSGEPLRAKVDLSFVGAASKKEAELVSNREPDTSPSVAYLRDGQTLGELCQEQYGDPHYMLTVARYNKLPNILNLQAGQRILLPPKK
jgi:hypothetical protein